MQSVLCIISLLPPSQFLCTEPIQTKRSAQKRKTSSWIALLEELEHRHAMFNGHYNRYTIRISQIIKIPF